MRPERAILFVSIEVAFILFRLDVPPTRLTLKDIGTEHFVKTRPNNKGNELHAESFIACRSITLRLYTQYNYQE
jgi:hypothetical protein